MDTNPHLSCQWSVPCDWDGLTTASVPDEPGYYAFTDHNGPLNPTGGGNNVLYVGIATQSFGAEFESTKPVIRPVFQICTREDS